jgi:hypothetical protein
LAVVSKARDLLAQLAALVRLLGGTAGRAALGRGLTPYLGVAVVSAIVFGGNGMKAGELTGLAAVAPPFHALLLGGWLLLALPVARALLASPSAFPVRIFSVPGWAVVLVEGAGLIAVEAPWMVLWLAGAGWLAALGAGVVAAGAHALAVGRPRRGYEAVAALLWLVGFVLGPAAWPLALPALATGTRCAWISAPESLAARAARRSIDRTSAHPLVVLAASLLAGLWRGQRALLARWCWLEAGGLAIAALALRNNAPVTAERAVAIALATAVAPAVLGSLGLAGALLRTERQARWLLDVTGTPQGAPGGAAALALASWGLFFGLLHGVGVVLLGGASPAGRIVAGAVAAGATLAASAALCRRWADRGTGQDTGRVLVAGLVISAATTALVAAGRELGLAVALVAGLLAGGAGWLRALPPPPSVRARAAADQD